MKKTIIFLLIMLFVAGWQINAQYLTEGFETSVPPSGWIDVAGSNSDAGNNWAQNSSRFNSGAYSAFFDDFHGDNDRWLISPAIDLSTATAPQLIYFDNVHFSDYAGTQEVLYSTDYTGSGDPTLATWTTLNDVIGTENTWVENGPYTLPVSANVYIAFHYVGNWAAEWYLDDILVQETPTCPAPSDLAVANIAIDSAELSWTENGSATTWNIEYGPAGFVQGTGTTVAVTTNPYTLSGLSPGTGYEYYVQADCGGSDTSTWEGPMFFFTACTTISNFPYDYGFEELTSNSGGDWSASCWSGNPENTGATAFAPPYRWTAYTGATPSSETGPSAAHSGNMYAYTEASGSDTGDVAELISPVFDMTGLNQPQLSFYYHMYGDSMGNLYLDTYDGTTWTEGVWSISGQQQASHDATWMQVFVSIPNNTTQIKFRAVRGAGWNSDMAIDDILLEETPSCLTPTSLSASNITFDSAELSWTENGSATAWNIEYGPQGFTQGQGTVVAASSNPFTLNGLMSSTEYDFYVQADCGGGDTSSWYGPYTFKTLCTATQNLPYTQDFDTNSDCWTVEDTNGDGTQWERFTYSQAISCIDTAGTDYVMAVSYNSSIDMDDWLFSPGFNLTAGTDYTLTFTYGNDGGTSFPEDMDVYLTTGNNSTDALNGIQILSETGIDNGCHDYNNLAVTVPADGIYYVAFHGKSPADQDLLMIDDFSIMETPSCIPPSTLSAANITVDSAELSWMENGTATAWNIEYGPTGYTQGTGTIVNATTNPYTLTGLTQATTYDFYVQADCGSGDTSTWFGPYTFTTPGSCGFFQVDLIDSYGDGWNGGTLTVYVNGTAYLSDITLDTGSGPESYFIPVNTGDILSFDYFQGAYGEENEYMVYNSVGTLIADSGAGSNVPTDIGDPNIPSGFEACPSCPLPTGLTASNITSDSAELSWVENGTATTWNIEYGDAGFTQGQGTTITVTNNPYTVTGLQPNTAYDFYVQADCGGGDTSTWFGPYSLTTLCDTQALPYSQDFDSDSDCWTVEDTNGDGILWSRATSYGSAFSCVSGSSDYVMFMAANPAQNMDDWLFSPGFYLHAGTNYTIAFSYGNDESTTALEDMDAYLTTAPNSVDALNGTQFFSQTGISNGCHDFIDSQITVPADGVYYIAFHGKSPANQNYLMFDDFSIMETPPCPEPSSLSVANITTDSAELSWVENGSATAWNIEYGPTGYTQGNGTVVAVTTNPYTLTGLTSNTSYDFYVQTDCGGGNASAWVGPYTFTTFCDPVSLPYRQNFDTDAGCWIVEDTNGDNNTWSHATSNAPFSCISDNTDYVMLVPFNANSDMDDWLFSPGFNLVAGTNYTIMFSYGNDGGDTYKEDMDVYLTTDFNSATATNGTLLLSETDIANGCHEFVDTNVTVPADGIYYVAFHGKSPAAQNILMIDDFVIDATSNINELDNITGIYPNPTSGEFVIKSQDLNDDAQVFVYTMTGKEIYRNNIDSDTFTVNIRHIKKGVYLVKIISENKSYIRKLIVK